MNKYLNTNSVKFNKFVFLFILLFFIFIIYRVSYLSLSTVVDGKNLKEFASSRNTKKETIYANRGSIYDKDGNVLSQSINSYTVIAYLDPNRSDNKVTRHVVDKKLTAKELSRIINMSEEAILKLLNRNAYQVELGPGGRGISELVKEKIEDLKLPGIGFITSQKRYYPNNDFLSYVLGYAKTTDDGAMSGEMGIEEYYNSKLKGNDGFYEFQQDLNGFKIANTKENLKESIDGADIYLTIDSKIQYFSDTISKGVFEKYNPDWLVVGVMDAKTGAILASSSYPSFDPNIRNITNYLNPLVSYAFEPGSTMKTFSYMAVMEKGNYNGKDVFKSGVETFENTKDTISDWKPEGWGTIDYDLGFALSANTGIVNLTRKYITGSELKSYYELLGFGKKTNITLPKEHEGKIVFNYPIEIANAGFGQGILVTPIQMLQAMTAISNNGNLLKPYIVEKIVNSNTNKVEFVGGREVIGNVASLDTVNRIKDLMYNVINDDPSRTTGTAYKIDGYDIIGKTGTAQYINTSTGKYYTDQLNYIRSFMGMFPKDDPEIIIYVAIKKPNSGNASLIGTVKPLIDSIANYLGIYSESNKDNTIKNYEMPNLLNKNISVAKDEIKAHTNNIYIIGDGDKVISQYPYNVTVNSLNNVILITNYNNLQIPDLSNMSLKDVKIMARLLNIELLYEGSGYVYNQEFIDNKLIVKLKNELKK